MDALTALALSATNLAIVAYVGYWVIKSAVKAALKEHAAESVKGAKSATKTKS
jgi:hypothetical protein